METEAISPTQAAPKPEIMSLPKAAKLLESEGTGLSYARLLKLLREGRLPHYRSGQRFYVCPAVIRAAILDPNSTVWEK